MKTYIKPETSVINLDIENLMQMTGSDIDRKGNVNGIGGGTGGGTAGDDGYVDIDAKPHNLWDEGGVTDWNDRWKDKW